jgi:RHS repeat-associated protein
VFDELSGSRTLEVDPAGRVRSVRGDGWQETYTYSLTGAIESANWPGMAPAAGPRHYFGTLLAAAGSTVYTHDAEGRTVTRDRWRFQWHDDRLTGVVTPEGQRWRYRYDALGRRIAKQCLDSAGRIAEQTQFTWDGANLAEEMRSGAGPSVATVWEWAPESVRVLTQTRRVLGVGEAEFHAVVTDLVGAPSELVDDRGNVAWHLRMTLWGKVLAEPGEAYTPLRFPGQYHDAETGLHYNVHRYYDPDTGRYLSHDPLGLDPAPDSLAYVGNPTAWIDPLGLAKQASTPCAKAAAASGAGGGGKKPPNQNNATAGPSKLPAKRKRKYEEGTHGNKKNEQKRLDDEFEDDLAAEPNPKRRKVTGTTHESEHAVGYEVLGRNSGAGRGSGADQKALENKAWAYQEDKPSHRAHWGTGMHNDEGASGFTSQSYRDAQRNALQAGDANTAIQLNQLDYAFRPEFHASTGSTSGNIADNSYEHMVTNAFHNGHGLTYSTGPGVTADTPPLTRTDAAELLAARSDAARRGEFPNYEEELEAYHKTYKAPDGWDQTKDPKGKGKAP